MAETLSAGPSRKTPAPWLHARLWADDAHAPLDEATVIERAEALATTRGRAMATEANVVEADHGGSRPLRRAPWTSRSPIRDQRSSRSRHVPADAEKGPPERALLAIMGPAPVTGVGHGPSAVAAPADGEEDRDGDAARNGDRQ